MSGEDGGLAIARIPFDPQLAPPDAAVLRGREAAYEQVRMGAAEPVRQGLRAAADHERLASAIHGDRAEEVLAQILEQLGGELELASPFQELARIGFLRRLRHFFFASFAMSPASEESAAMKASCGTSTEPMLFMRFLPSFCFSRSLRLREMSPP